MNISIMIRIIMITICILYGGLTSAAGGLQVKEKRISTLSSISMITGGLLTAFAAPFSLYAGDYGIYILVSGLLLIHVSAISNGIKMYGHINPSHHIARLIISVLCVTLFITA